MASSPWSDWPDEMTLCPPAKTASASSADAGPSAGLRPPAGAATSRLSPRERDRVRGIARGAALKPCTDRLHLILKTYYNRRSPLKEILGLDDALARVRHDVYPGVADAFMPILPLNTP